MLNQQLRVVRVGGLTPWLLVPSVVLGLAISALYIATAGVNAVLFMELLGERRIERIATLIAIIAALLLVRPLLDICAQLAANRAGLAVKSKLRNALLNETNRQGPMRVGLGRSGTIQSVITDGVEAIEPYFIKYFSQLIVTAITACALTVALGTVSIPIALVGLACGLAVVAIPRLWDAALAERGQSHWIAYETLNADFIDAMMGMGTLKSFGAAEDYGRRLERASNELLTSTLGQLRLSLGETGLSGMMKVLGPGLALVIAIVQMRAGNLDVTQLFFVTLLSVEMFRPFTQLSAAWHESFFGLSALPSMGEIFAAHSEEDPRAHREIQPLDPALGVTFADVSYRYIGAEEPALEHVSFTIPAGCTTSIVGLSGSGKSTALGILMGFDEPTSGTISVCGVNPSAYDASRLATLVPQDPIIFAGTIRDILAAANPHASDEEMLEALRIAHADGLHVETDTAGQHTDVLDVTIYEHAKNLSGGQKQRLAIARALVRTTPILILDESTSALDSATEHQLLADLRSARPKLTLICVTHRIDTAAASDHVIVLASRRVECEGSPAALAADPDSAWSQLVAAQRGEATR